MVKTNLLLVDDDVNWLAELKSFLERCGFNVITAVDGIEALDLVPKSHPDLIILDLKMPRLDGRETLRRLRRANDNTPVIVLSQIDTVAERVLTLQDGADDYLNRSCDPAEFVARIQAVLRRVQHGNVPLRRCHFLKCGDLVLDRFTRQVKLQEKDLNLGSRSLKAFKVLEQLMLQPQEVVTRQQLLRTVWGTEHVNPRAVDIIIKELRQALDDDPLAPHFIETVHGEGYRFLREVEGQL